MAKARRSRARKRCKPKAEGPKKQNAFQPVDQEGVVRCLDNISSSSRTARRSPIAVTPRLSLAPVVVTR